MIMRYNFEVSRDENEGVFVSGSIVVMDSVPDLKSYRSFAKKVVEFSCDDMLFSFEAHASYPGGVAVPFYRKSGAVVVSAYAFDRQTADKMISDFMDMTNVGTTEDLREHVQLHRILENEAKIVGQALLECA